MSEELKKYIRSVKDFPIEGIMFRDITTLLIDPVASKKTIDELYNQAKDLNITKVVGIESRGFLFGMLLAEKLGVGFVPIRKPGKLPAETESVEYELEYGTDKIEIHKDAINQGDKILLHDDLLATGGTAEAACKLIEKLGGEVVQVSFIVELSFLNGREHIKKYDVRTLVYYESE
ncbi:MAG: adenine phosphoribosyltransferase [Bacteroidetes bacterium]|nr:adenine phosphoribosyltransferase [Bacteroidota bacterium]MCH8941532.1 adenine phosphoribosyltransferase [Bacteroidota bacterium]